METTQARPAVISLIVEWAREARAKRNDWPGYPLTQMPLAARDELQAAIDAGLVRIESRPAKVNPNATRSYVVPINR